MQKTVAASSAESEYQALAAAAHEILFLRQLLGEMSGVDVEGPTLLRCDNQPSIRIAQRCATTVRHVRVRFHIVRQLVEEGIITLEYCDTGSNIADLLTKALPKPAHLRFTSSLMH